MTRFLCVLAFTGCAAAQAGMPQSPRIEGVDAVAITVADLDRSVAFYCDVLSFETVSKECQG